MSALLELAERCEQATGPDRELDCAIYNAVPDGPNRKSERLPMERWGDRFDDGWRTMWANREDKYPEQLKRYTASLDAAMALVPDDLAIIQVSRLWVKDKAQLYDGFTCVGEGTARSTALALCAAAIRARAAQ